MKKNKEKQKYRKRPYLFRTDKSVFNLEIGELVYPDGEDDEDYRMNSNPNRKEINKLTKENQLR
jgi:hypothetical protein